MDISEALGRHIAGDEFLGVRVIAHLAPASSVHYLAEDDYHRLGGCVHCRPGGAWR